MGQLTDIVFDCRHPASLARFWAFALDDYVVAPYDDAEMARLARLGVHDPENDPTVILIGLSGGPRIWFQLVPEPKTTKNRVHLDIRVADRQAAATRLESGGAHVLDDRPHDRITVMQDPEGNEFCIID